jgi:hypothetical protein
VDLASPGNAGNLLVLHPGDNALLVAPFGTGVDNSEGSIRFYGESRMEHPSITQWHPVFLAGVNVTLSTQVGIVGGVVLNTERYADIVAFRAGEGDANADYLTFPSNEPGWFALDHRGFDKVIAVFQNTAHGAGAATTGLNILWRPF